WGRGTAPTIPSTGLPSLKRSIVGIDVIRNRSAVRGLSSTFSFPRRRVAACALATCSRIGATRWHGPHHSAQKSTRRRPGFWISESKVASVSRIGPEKATVTGFVAEAAMSSRSFRARIAASSGSSTKRAPRQPDKRVCRSLAGDLRHRPEFLGQRAQQANRRTLEAVFRHHGLRRAPRDAQSLRAVSDEVLEDLERLARIPLEDRVGVPAIQAVRRLRQQVRLRLRDDELLQERLLSDGKGDQPDEGHLDDEPRGPEVHAEVRQEDLEQQLADRE